MSVQSEADLDGMFEPRSVAVVGASDDVRKWGHWLARGALAGRDHRDVALVNRAGGSVLGMPTTTSVAGLPEPPELVVVATPAALVRDVVAESAELGTRWFVVITAGVGDPPSVVAERELVELARHHGARILGPNCMGLVDTSTSLCLSWGDFPAGAVGLVSQSGNVGLEIGRMLDRVGHGFSRFVSLGNQRDIDAADAVESLVRHDATRMIAAYVEDFKDGRRLSRAFAAAREAGKPVLLLTVGHSAAATRAAVSHTGALVTASDVVGAMCAEVGALHVSGSGELVDTVQMLLARAPVRGPRVAVLGDSGGQCALAADTLTGAGLSVPPLEEDVVARLRAVLPSYAGTSNPVDLAGVGEADLANYPRIAGLLAGGNTDVTVLTGYFGDYATSAPGLADAECAAAILLAEDAAEDAARDGGGVVVHSMGRNTLALAELSSRGVPVYERIEQAAVAIANAARWYAAGPVASPPVVAPTSTERLTLGDYPEVRALLAEHGVELPAAEIVHDPAEAVAAARSLGYPVALKAMGLLHKTEAGGVRLGLRDDADLMQAFEQMRKRTGAAAYAVERMHQYAGSVELIMGVRHDPSFGPIAMVGLGGTTAELAPDTALGLAPLSRERAVAMLAALRHAPLLAGWRGAPPVDVVAAARTLVAVARAGVEHPELVELEVNPVLVHPGGAVALDAAAALRQRPGHETRERRYDLP